MQQCIGSFIVCGCKLPYCYRRVVPPWPRGTSVGKISGSYDQVCQTRQPVSASMSQCVMDEQLELL